MKTLVFGGKLVNEGATRVASVVVDGDTITDIIEGTETPRGDYDSIVDATGCFVMPGVIDCHVHFRDPGLTEKADMETESRAAAYDDVICLRKHFFLQKGYIGRAIFQRYNFVASIVSTGRIYEDQLKTKVGLK